MSRRRATRFHAWAIDAGPGEGLLSRKFFGLRSPKHVRGCPVALFETREAARDALAAKVKRRRGGPFPMAQVRAVKVSVAVARPFITKQRRRSS